MPNMTPYEPNVVDLEFFLEQARHSIDQGDIEGAIKALQNAQLLEDAIIIYRLTRAPKRKVFNVEVGGGK